MSRCFAIVVALLTVGACTPAPVQLTSGQSYLAQFEADDASARKKRKSRPAPSLDQKIRKAASIEPILRFPARIGLARIENGRMTDLPPDEAAEWKTLSEGHRQFGQFVTVNVLGTLGSATQLSRYPASPYSVERIRLAAARQHLDAVLIYEVNGRAKKYETPLAFTDLTIVGGAILPTRKIKAQGTARALLVDVRNGYPYGSATASTKLERFSTTWGADGIREELRISALKQAYGGLAPKVKTLFVELLAGMRARRVKRRRVG